MNRRIIVDGAFKIDVLYEDNHLLVVLKPEGLLTQSDAGGAPDLLSVLKADERVHRNKPGQAWLGLVHRLDRPASGVMVFARTSKAASRLSAALRGKQFDKYYLAVTHGRPPDQAHLRDRLLKRDNGQVVVDDQGRDSWLDLATLAEDRPSARSLVAIRTGTGRPHQIRVQMASRGWPLVGDRRYGREDLASKEKSLALFAAGLCFPHPISGERMCFWCQPPNHPPWSAWQQCFGQSGKPADDALVPGLFAQVFARSDL